MDPSYGFVFFVFYRRPSGYFIPLRSFFHSNGVSCPLLSHCFSHDESPYPPPFFQLKVSPGQGIRRRLRRHKVSHVQHKPDDPRFPKLSSFFLTELWFLFLPSGRSSRDQRTLSDQALILYSVGLFIPTMGRVDSSSASLRSFLGKSSVLKLQTLLHPFPQSLNSLFPLSPFSSISHDPNVLNEAEISLSDDPPVTFCPPPLLCGSTCFSLLVS